MANEKPQSADFEEEPLPEVKSVHFDLSDQELSNDSKHANSDRPPENESPVEPEGIFSLFDREFQESSRSPVEPSESNTFDKEFLQSFDSMFKQIKKDESLPLFDSSGLPLIATPPKVAPTYEKQEDSLPSFVEPFNKKNANLNENANTKPVNLNNELDSNDALEDEALPLIGSDARTAKIEQEEQSEEPRLEPLELDPDEEESDNTEEEVELPSPINLDILSADDDSYADNEDEDLSTGLSDDWDKGNLEEINFDDSDDDELYDVESEDQAGASDFDDFAKLALGLSDSSDFDEEDDEISEEDDFKVEEIDSTEESDAFEDISIMSSEDVANYKSPFEEEELKFQDHEPATDDPDPFAMEGESKNSSNEDPEDYDQLELDPFGEEASALAAEADQSKNAQQDENQEETEKSKGKDKKPKKPKKPRKSFSLPTGKLVTTIVGLALFPWRIYSKLTAIVFGLIESVIKLLAKIPLLGIPFKMLSTILSSVPMSIKSIVVLAVIVSTVWGGSTVVSNLLPKPSSQIELPDSGGANFEEVQMENQVVKGKITNTGNIDLIVAPIVEVSERKLTAPSSWFKPKSVGKCEGEFIEVPINKTVDVSYNCNVKITGSASLKPSLKD